MPSESDSTVVVTPVQGVGEGLSQEAGNGAHNHPADAPLTPSEWSKIIEAVYGDRDDFPNTPDEAVDALGPAVESILSARLDALHAENAELREALERERNAVIEHSNQAYAQGREVTTVQIASERDAARAERDKWYEKHLDGVAFANKLRAERDALRDAITALADTMHGSAVNGRLAVTCSSVRDELRALLPDEAGERRE